MASKTGKPAAKKAAGVQAKTGAGAAVAERSKDAAKKPAFGKAAPKKVTPAARATTASEKPAPKARKPKSNGPSLATRIAQVATGAVVASAKGAASLAASITGKEGAKSK